MSDMTKYTATTIHLTSSQHQKLRQLAHERTCTQSELVRLALEEYFQNHEGETDDF